MSHELTILAINGTFIAFAYYIAYPFLTQKTATALLWRDAVISCAALVLAGLLFGGKGLRFDLLVASANWWAFSILTMAIMEVPFFVWFTRRHNITF